MKRSALILCLIAIGLTLKAQSLKSFSSIDSASIEAVNLNKPLMLMIDAPKRSFLQNISKASYASAIDDKAVIKKINSHFVFCRTTLTDRSIRYITVKYNITKFPCYLFFHPNKDLFYKDFGNSLDKNKYLEMLNSAKKAANEKSLSDLEHDYLSNKGDNVVLKKLIDARKRIGITNNAQLIENYVENLKVSDFDNYQTVLYILEAGPFSNGKAYKFANLNRKIVDSIYKKEPLQKRIDFNNYIIKNTMDDAIKHRNIQKAQASANFSSGTFGKDYVRGSKSYASEMLRYYSAVSDTANYFRNAVYYYDTYYMNLSADSIKKLEIKSRKNITGTPFFGIAGSPSFSTAKIDSIQKANPSAKIITKTFTTSSQYNSYANELNNVAWRFYILGTKNINYLAKALIWSRRSIELDPQPGYYDTMAHILYRMEYFSEAIKTQQDAIEILLRRNEVNNEFKVTLEKMKSRIL